MDGIDKEKLIKLSQSQKRLVQYSYLKKWSTGAITGIDCIENIVESEKLIFINEDFLKAAIDEKE